jgi:hypothetical protein
MVDDLPRRPSPFAVGRFDLLRRETLHRSAQCGGSLLDILDEFLPLLLVRRTVIGKFPDGIAGIAHLHFLLIFSLLLACGLAGEGARATTSNRKLQRTGKINSEARAAKDKKTMGVSECSG